jgi:AcrR family transcriptional regulator
MEGTRRGPVVVVGGGIVGCAIAVHLADHGVRPVVVDLDRPGQGASASSFASLSAFGKDPVAYYELACAGMPSWSRWAERLGGDVGLRRDGEVRWAGDPREGDVLAERVASARRSGYAVRLVDEAELRRLLPAAEPGQVAAASFAPNDGQVEPPLVLRACRAALAQAGARLLLGRAARVRVDDDGVRVEVGDELLRPSTTVLAAGAEAVEVAAARRSSGRCRPAPPRATATMHRRSPPSTASAEESPRGERVGADADRILEAAEEVLRRFGPAKATVVDVARALGVSHGSVYRHFPSKAALREAVTERWLARVSVPLAAVADEDGPAPERLRRWLGLLVASKRRMAREDPELFATYNELAGEAREVVRAHVDTLVAQLAAIIADGVERGELQAANPAAAGRAVFDATARFHNPVHAPEWSDPRIDAAVEGVWSLVLSGLAYGRSQGVIGTPAPRSPAGRPAAPRSP